MLKQHTKPPCHCQTNYFLKIAKTHVFLDFFCVSCIIAPYNPVFEGITMNKYDIVIIGSGPAGLGAAFFLSEHCGKKILMLEKGKISSGGLRNDCKQNYTFPVGFPVDLWQPDEARELLDEVARILKPEYEQLSNLERYSGRAARLGVELLNIRQAHVGTDRAAGLISDLLDTLARRGVEIRLETTVTDIRHSEKSLSLNSGDIIHYGTVILAPGRSGFSWLQRVMNESGIHFQDNTVDIGVRIEAREENYRIVQDYYDPKFLFPGRVRTFCTNSRAAFVVREKYEHYYSVNGHSFSQDHERNGLVNFAMLKTITLTDPVVSGHEFAEILGRMAMQLGGGKPMMQRIGDFRTGKRSSTATFNNDLYDFEPTLKSCTPGDVSLAIPAKILRDIWNAMKKLDTIVPGLLHPSTIIYYPEIKTYANKPRFINDSFMAKESMYIIGDGGGTSRGITAAWASGIRAARDIVRNSI